MPSPYANPTVAKRGQIYRCPSKKVRGGFRYVEIQRVYRPALALATATVREVTKSGRDIRPDYVHDGVEVSTSFDSSLDTDETMHAPYELVSTPTKGKG